MMAGDDGRAVVPGTHWRHLNLIEKHSLIPIRSVHMLCFAASYARRKGVGTVNVFVGEMHNSDMSVLAREWDAVSRWDGPQGDELRRLVETARRAADGRMGRVEKAVRYLSYIGGLAAPLFAAGALAVAAFAGIGFAFNA